MSKTYSAGIVTAYGAAKRAGYTGTYEDFCRQQAGYAESAAAVEQAKNTAVSAASTATAKAGEAATAATAAQTAKTQTEAAASQALTDISTARSGAISAVQTEGQTQTANARAQARAAAASATTASTKASEASASATSAGQSATNAAASATSAAQSASNAQDVLDSIPADYSDLSEDVDQLKADLDSLVNMENVSFSFNWEHGGISNGTGETNNDGSLSRSRDVAYYKSDDLTIINGSSVVAYAIYYTKSGNTYTFNSATSITAGASKALVSGMYVRMDVRGSLEQAALVTGVMPSEIVTVIENLQSNALSTQAEVDVLEEHSTIDTEATIAYADMDVSQTGLIKTDGSIASYANCYLSDYISCIPGTDISYLIAYVYGNYVAVAFYDRNKAHISGSDITAESGTSGSFAKVEGTSTIPANAKYFRFTVSKNTAASVTAGNQFVSYSYNKPVKEVVEDIVSNGTSTQWKNKRWCAFGTSITDTSYINQETGEVTGKYVPFLAQYSGLNVTNRGIAGGTIGSDGIHGGSSSILNAILNSNDLDTFDIITLEGFVNDFAAAISIGEIGDTGNTTMYGALHQALSYILANSHAEVVLITETTGQEYTLSGGTTVNYKVLRKNSLDLYQQDYNDVIIRLGQFYGVHVIDAGGKSQINQYHPEYIIDQIHHTTLGGAQYAKTVWEELKNIYPAKVSSN